MDALTFSMAAEFCPLDNTRHPQVILNGQQFEAPPVMFYPNPLNPKRYIVINSGFTFREFDYANNARQSPKLPDWAIVDVSVPAPARKPGGIADAGFFDEQ